MVDGEVEEGRAFLLRNSHGGEAGGVGVVVVAVEVTLEHLNVCFGDGDEAGASDGHIEGPGAVIVVEVNSADLADGVGTFVFFVGDGCVLVVEVTPGHHSFVQDAITVVGLDFAEFYGLCAGYDGFCELSLEWQGEPVQGFRTRAVGVFAVEFGGALRGQLRSAVAKESRSPPLGLLP